MSAGIHLLETKLAKDQLVEPIDDEYIITATVIDPMLLDRWLFGFGEKVRDIVKSDINKAN